MWHQPKHVAFTVADSGYVVARAVGVGSVRHASILVAITDDDAVLLFKFGKGVVITDVVSFSMRDRKFQDRTAFNFIRKGSVDRFNAHEDMFANKMQIAVAY